ncbi:MAG: hypothetical protein EOS58_27075 [Mesorhizobium sp.]|uniref:hypothetical protein n=2 Tax=Mesorhizobium TaxID=68287 RepID=UPI000F753125|nr:MULTISPECIES: hypothetical protein [unclassified Mesorhizobium]RVC45067.1 hypothetical protein EN781_11390 [Mesorhizobium sp. M4A.F.Ca.ET.090.04.2.1]RVD72031.1 hypothetical protein EN751_12255 [Mesorhizobium sp. M4A.F.Ca.ET.029.04.2.1]AZO47720.1 hypothetical protein EJ073_07675 [Mesorhizobium sp. M4B.F.Ca.ET.058.02.1.1]RVD44330.1 hypothetical protein EN742_02530 [Mesorhizobium sp. M4A.F.Ca.ET.020.02.1.1]RWC18832.1 MAG: hypothetical protein EOS53_15340 [Mesorhizobium sp.]
MMTEEAMAAVLAVRNTAAEILGVVDSANKTDAAVDVRRLGEAVQFLANAPILGYDVRAAMVLYGDLGTPTLRARDCEQLWAKYGKALLAY